MAKSSFPGTRPAPPDPDPPPGRPHRILAVWTRALDGVDGAGRVNVARSVREALAPLGSLTEARLQNALEQRRLASAAAAAWALLRGLLSGRPLPLQCALFAHSRGAADALSVAGRSDVIYLDGVRTLPLLRRLRRRHPHLQVVVDADDLMSRRCAELLSRRLPLSLGYLEASVPGPLARVATSRTVARLVLGYERLALRHAERELLALADRVVLLNREDIEEAGLKEGQAVDLTSHFEGEERTARRFTVVPFCIPRRCAATYFPETNVLVPVRSVADKSNTPASKSVVISIKPSAEN